MKILIIEDDAALSRQLRSRLEQDGYTVETSADGIDGGYRGEAEPADAIILDLGLPGRDGLSLLKDWRSAGVTVPVLILTARDRWSDKVQGIDAGADDYLTKPFAMEELLARLRALIRRAHGLASPVLTAGPVSLDTRTSRVMLSGDLVPLTAFEFRILSYLMHHKGRVVSRGELIDHVYAQSFDRDSNTVEVFIARLRRKLGTHLIQTVRGQGYMLVAT